MTRSPQFNRCLFEQSGRLSSWKINQPAQPEQKWVNVVRVLSKAGFSCILMTSFARNYGNKQKKNTNAAFLYVSTGFFFLSFLSFYSTPSLPSLKQLKVFGHKISVWPTGHVVTLNQRPTAGHKAEISLNESKNVSMCIKT